MEIHNGKIGRLPEAIREELNRRLADGEAGGPLLEWLNALPPVQAVLAAQFAGRPVSEQNLSVWRTDGFQRWLQKRERRTVVQELAQDLGDLKVPAAAPEAGADLGKYVSRVFAADFAAAAREVLDGITDPGERCQRLQGFLRTLNHLRRDEYQTGRLQIARERRDYEAAAEERENEDRREGAMVARLMQGARAAELFASPDFTDQMLAVGLAEESLRPEKPDEPPAGA